MVTKELYGDTWLSSQPVYLTDMDRCQPCGALSRDPQIGRWRLLDYETDTLSGVMLLAGEETAAPDVTYPVDASGWHAVSVGMMPHYGGPSQVLIRTSGSDTFTTLRAAEEEGSSPHEIEAQEVFWRIVDLTDQDLVIGQAQYRLAEGGTGALGSNDSQVVYIKLVPLADEEAAALKADRARTDTRRMFAHNDAHGVHYANRPTTAEHIRRHIEGYRDTDFGRICWEAGGGDLLQYFSNIGRRSTFDGLEDFARRGYRKIAESWRAFRDQGVDPFQVALDHTHEIGMEFHAGYRVTGFHYPPPLDYFNYGSSFFKYHPELRSVAKDGSVGPRVSFAYPELRRYLMSVLREIAGYDVDGISLLYNRRPPFMDYEPPLVEGFTAEFGEDPRRLDDMDPRWLAFRARTMTQFMREVREAMDDEARRQGRRKIEVSAIVSGRREENELWGLDVKAWIDEGLADTIIPYTSAPHLQSAVQSWTDAADLEHFVSLTKGSQCRLVASILPREQAPEEYRRMAGLVYGAGAEEVFCWDCDPGRSDSFRRLGHKEDIAAWSEAGQPSLAPARMTMRKIGGWDLSYQTPG